MTEVVMYESDEAATYKKGLSGWVSRDGRFFGQDEHIARYAGSTHKKCDCGGVTSKHYIICEKCRAIKADERYQALESKDWGGEPLVIFGTDTYFFSDDIFYYLNDLKEGEPAPQLVICEPIIAPYIEDYGIDYLPEQWTIGDADPKLEILLAEVNNYIHENKPILSWQEGKFRTSVSLPETN